MWIHHVKLEDAGGREGVSVFRCFGVSVLRLPAARWSGGRERCGGVARGFAFLLLLLKY